jgi:V/A-type H+-transporting ATPase subunit I
LDRLSDSQLDVGALGDSGPLLTGVCLLLPSATDPPSVAQLLSVTVPLGEQRAILALVRRQDAEPLCRQVEAVHGRCVPRAKWLEGSARQSRSRLNEHRSALEPQIGELTGELRELADRTGVARALGVLQRLDWLTGHARNLALTEDFCWVTGWTTAADASVLNRAHSDIGEGASVEFLEAPEHVRPPSLFDNPAWARPFEVFTRAMGMPAADEADPSTWVAVVVPLMFGYICGDVGHGLVIAMAGLILQRHWPVARLPVFCGAAATGFGFLYGDVFGLEDVLDPLWLRPLDAPLLTLAVPFPRG